MNPELWKMKRDARTPEASPCLDNSITNYHATMMRMRSADDSPGKVTPDAVEPRQPPGEWTKPDDAK